MDTFSHRRLCGIYTVKIQKNVSIEKLFKFLISFKMLYSCTKALNVTYSCDCKSKFSVFCKNVKVLVTFHLFHKFLMNTIISFFPKTNKKLMVCLTNFFNQAINNDTIFFVLPRWPNRNEVWTSIVAKLS